jgi:hypothetical protein
VDFLDSVGALRAAQRTTSADRCPRPVGTTARRGLRISRPRPALHRRGPAASVARAPATATAPASLSRVSDCISRSAAGTQQTTSADQCPRPVGTTDATRPPHLAPSASGRAARTSPAARDSGRSAVAAANAPGQQCVRSRTTSGAMPRPVAAARRRIATTANLPRSSRRRRRAASAKNCWRRRTYRSVDHTQSSRPAVPRAASCGANRRRLLSRVA